MDKQGWDSFFNREGHVLELQPLNISYAGCPLWDWQLGHTGGADDIVLPPASTETLDSDYYFPNQNPFQDDFFSTILSEIELCEKDVVISSQDQEEEINEQQMVASADKCREERVITFEEVSRYFYMPLTQAARELNVGLTLLKKKCRELGIPRWPHRKMKSLQTLIKNVQELRNADGEAGETQLRCALEILERERRLMEKEPAVEMEEKTKRLRQACFKANYKKRRLMQASSSPSSFSSSPESGDSRHRLR